MSAADHTGPAGRAFSAPGLLLLSLMAVVAGGCAHTPRGVAEHYLTALQQFNYGECYALLSTQDRHDRMLKEFLAEIPLAPAVTPDLFRAVLHDTRYELGRQHRTANRARVPLTITTVDLPLWERTLDAEAGADGSGADQAVHSLETGDYPKFTYVDQIVLVKEHHHWHVYANFATRDRAADLHREALKQYHQHQYRQAIATYQRIMAMLAKDDATGALGLAAHYGREMKLVENVEAQLPQATAYAPKLKLSHVAMKMSEEHRPAIFGQVTNTGKKPIDEVQVAVKWYMRKDQHLRMVFSEDHPVVATPIVFTSFAEPVLPMVHNQTRDFGFILSAPVQVQQDAAPYVTVSSIAFTQSSAPLKAKPVQTNASKGAPDKHPQPAPSPGTASATPARPSQIPPRRSSS